MYKILIVDDESFVREGIKENIDWKKHGFELVCDCENGLEAMEAVDKFKPDIVLTDICMPFVDGLELTRYIVEKYPWIKVVILTGYDEFEYAQQAVKLKAFDYMLKPITANELRKVLDKLKTELDEEYDKLEDLNKLKKLLRESLPLLKERFLNCLLQGTLKSSEIKEKFEYFNIHLAGNTYLALTVDIDDYGDLKLAHPETDAGLFQFAVYNISEEILSQKQNCIVFQNNTEKTVIILGNENERSLQESAIGISEEIRQAVEKYLKFTVTIGIGKTILSISDLYDSYKYALSALDYRFLLGKNRVISIHDMEGSLVEKSAYNKELELKLVSAVKIGTAEDIDNITSQLIQNLKESYTSINKCYYHVHQIVMSVIGALNELGHSESEVFGENRTLLTEVYQFKTLEETKLWLDNLFKRASEYLRGRRNDYYQTQAEKAVEYIKSKYDDPDISLNSICKHLLMSTSYFSSIFKSHTGQTFVEYLTKVRVEMAMKLLKGTNLKTYEVAEKVGYKDPHYFSMIFKKTLGCTPSDYRERL
ncbi:MAG: response regulator [Clostridia bacterium]|nr:response regulator [Clostridia bacterium]